MVEAPRSNFDIFGKGGTKWPKCFSLRPIFTPAHCQYSLKCFEAVPVLFRIEEGRRINPATTLNT